MKTLYQTKPNKRGMIGYLYVDDNKRYFDFAKKESDSVAIVTKNYLGFLRKYYKYIGYKSDYDFPLF